MIVSGCTVQAIWNNLIFTLSEQNFSSNREALDKAWCCVFHCPPPCSRRQRRVSTGISPWVTTGKKRGLYFEHIKKWAFFHTHLRTALGDKEHYCFCPSRSWHERITSVFFLSVQCLSTRSTLPEYDSEHETWQNKTHFNSLSWPRPTKNIAVLLLWAGMQSYLLHSQEQQPNSSPWCWHE